MAVIVGIDYGACGPIGTALTNANTQANTSGVNFGGTETSIAAPMQCPWSPYAGLYFATATNGSSAISRMIITGGTTTLRLSMYFMFIDLPVTAGNKQIIVFRNVTPAAVCTLLITNANKIALQNSTGGAVLFTTTETYNTMTVYRAEFIMNCPSTTTGTYSASFYDIQGRQLGTTHTGSGLNFLAANWGNLDIGNGPNGTTEISNHVIAYYRYDNSGTTEIGAVTQNWQFKGVIGSASSTATSATATLTPSTSSEGGSLFLAIGAGGGASLTVSSVTDTKGNTWTIINNGVTSTSGSTYLAYCLNSRQLTSADTVTVTFSGSQTSVGMQLLEFAGIASFDVSATLAATTSAATGISNTTTAADDLQICVTAARTATFTGTLAPNFTILNAVLVGTAGSLVVSYGDALASGANAIAETLSASVSHSGILASFKGAAPPIVPDVNMALQKAA